MLPCARGACDPVSRRAGGPARRRPFLTAVAGMPGGRRLEWYQAASFISAARRGDAQGQGQCTELC